MYYIYNTLYGICYILYVYNSDNYIALLMNAMNNSNGMDNGNSDMMTRTRREGLEGDFQELFGVDQSDRRKYTLGAVKAPEPEQFASSQQYLKVDFSNLHH